MNLTFEFSQEIIVTTKNGYILRLHLSKMSPDFRLYGEYYDATEKEWWVVGFSNKGGSSPSQLVENCLKDFSAAMAKKKDSIVSLHNPCNTPFLSQGDQEMILEQRSIAAIVSVNWSNIQYYFLVLVINTGFSLFQSYRFQWHVFNKMPLSAE